MEIYLEDVFKKSGIPTYTFVKPLEYNNILVSLRTRGRSLIVEGPSGIGKTTCVQKVLEELAINKRVLKLSARRKEDIEFIEEIPNWGALGTVIIDDFHILPENLKSAISDYMKVLADEEREGEKLILIGINKAGDSLIKLAPDLNNRIDTIRLERNPDDKVVELIELGVDALNIKLQIIDEIVVLARGSFHITQYLCNEICTYAGVINRKEHTQVVKISIEVIKEKVLDEFSRLFYSKARDFAVGTRLRKEGRAPYLHLLYWLANSDDWTIQIDNIVRVHPEHKISISQVVDKGFLETLIRDNSNIQDVIHYDSNSRVLTIEDPKFMFYIRNILWSKFAKQVGYLSISFKSKYDFALSFAGENRDFAERLFHVLEDSGVAVFYDKNEQHRILAANVEDYLAPIYNSEARYVVPLLSRDYPKKIWTKFESENFKHRFGSNAIIPIWYSDNTPGMFDETRKYGGLTFDVTMDIDIQAVEIGKILIQRISEDRILEDDDLNP